MARCWYFEWEALLRQHELASRNVWQKHEGRISWTGHMGLYRQSLYLHDGFVLESMCHSCLRSVTNYNWHRGITPVLALKSLVIDQFLLCCQYFSDLLKVLLLHQGGVPHLLLLVTVQSKHWVWLWMIRHWMYSLLIVTSFVLTLSWLMETNAKSLNMCIPSAV